MTGGTVQMAGAAVVLFGVAAAYGLRRRRVASIQLEEDEGTKSHFELMNSNAGVSV